MDKRLHDILNGNEDNYLFPFYWQHGDHTHLIPEQIQRIYDSGCRAFCVEARPHPDFAGEGWWRDMDIILREAKERSMKVWLLDDDHFPTGHAAGMIAKKYPHLRQWELIERHLDVVGPAPDTSLIVIPDDDENILIGAYAYKRRADELETCFYDATELTGKISKDGKYLTWNIPSGVWRVFFYYKSRRGGRPEYIDMINPESVRVLIDSVYESHFEHYSSYFGNTFAGFFSDEPCFGNQVFGQQRFDFGFYDARIGKHGLALPWNETVLDTMRKKLGYDPVPHLNLLWYEDGENGDRQADIRHAYMDTITRMYSECFNKQVADWCREHGVQYIGHVIEDMNCHMRHGAEHYFRALRWQDMSGIDVVLHQIMPGMSDYLHTSTCATGVSGGPFFDYILSKLGASLAHLTPHMQGRAMCEVFGAYGWGEDSRMMKYLIDHLLVRGINRFVPHAFSSKFPDRDCPPHFGAEGHDPNFEAFTELMRYTNKVAHLLDRTKHIANAAILYHIEGEWASRFKNASTLEPIATVLYDNHIDYDIISPDMLAEDARIRNKKLCICDEDFDCLIIPYADHMPKALLDRLKVMKEEGLPVWFMRSMPENADFKATVMNESDLPAEMTRRCMRDVIVKGDHPKLRIYHCVREKHDIFMLVNEDFESSANTEIKLPCCGDYASLDLLTDICFSGHTDSGELCIDLLPNQSQILFFGDTADLMPKVNFTEEIPLSPGFELELAECDDLTCYKSYGSFDSFFNINSPNFWPDFSGKMRYSFNFDINKDGRRIFLDLGKAGQNAELYVNDKKCGIRITAPYLFDISDAAVDGTNKAVVIVSNTLAQKVRDRFSQFLQLAPSGLLGGVSVKR